MLEDELYEPIVSWTPAGDSFVVKNMNDFTKHVLPRHFRHSNFASFVRQLNKYDFHKVKSASSSSTSGNSLDDLMMDPMSAIGGGANNSNISATGDQIWEFKHPDFIRGREDLLENVKRKAPTGKKLKGPGDGDREGSPTMFDNNPHEIASRAAESYTELKGQVATLTAVQEQMNRHIDGLTKQYQGIIGEMLTWQRNMVQQDQLMQNLIQYLMNMENGEHAKQAFYSRAYSQTLTIPSWCRTSKRRKEGRGRRSRCAAADFGLLGWWTLVGRTFYRRTRGPPTDRLILRCSPRFVLADERNHPSDSGATDTAGSLVFCCQRSIV